MRSLLSIVIVGSLSAIATLAVAKPITDSDPNAVDVAKTPVTDLNIDKQEIPEVLLRAQRQPYDLTGLSKCRQLISAVEELDDLMGADIDLPQEERDRVNAGRLAKTVVGSFIPFRGLIREVSGANDHQKRVRAAIQAGFARRGFLKGIGQSRGCKYPARPATREMIAARLHELNSDKKREKSDKDESNENVRFTSEPIVQKTN